MTRERQHRRLAAPAKGEAGVWLLIVTGLHSWWRTTVPSAATRFIAGLCVAYLLLPLLHHLVGTDGYYHISNSSNFFAGSMTFELAAWIAAVAAAIGVTQLQKHTARRRTGLHSNAASQGSG